MQSSSINSSNLQDIHKLNFLPLDLPYAECNPNDIKDYMGKNGSRTSYDWTEKINNPWNHVVVRIPERRPSNGEIIGSGWRPDFKRRFPKVVEVVELMPYEKINYVYIMEQVIEVLPHYDYASKNPYDHQEPATYRISLLMEDSKSFYICENDTCEIRRHPLFPSETNCWVFSNKNFKHGSTVPSNGYRKILLAVGGILNEKKHYELLESSYDKYHNYSF
jgi:hypothetical protein